MDLLFPTWVPIAEAEWRLVDFTGRSSTTLSGAQKRVSRGQRLGVSYRLQNLSGADRHAVMAWAAALRGGYNTAILYDPANRQRGSFPGGEMFANNTFADGTSGWINSSAPTHSFTVADRTARLTALDRNNPGIYQNFTLAPATPYAIRSVIMDGPNTAGLNLGRFITDGTVAASDYSTSRGLGTIAYVPGAAVINGQWPYVMGSSSGYTPGTATALVPYTSLQRCALVDAGPNAMQYANDLTNAAWSKGASTATYGDTAPDGTATASRITEDTSNGLHYVVQTRTRASGVQDVCSYGFFKRAVGTRDVRLWATNVAGTDNATAYFDLGAGTAGSIVLGGAATNGRSFIVPAGNNWYFCAVVARMPTSSSIACEVDLVSGGVPSYVGTTGAISTWKVGAAVTSVPTVGAVTTSAGTTGSTSAGVTSLALKGLPASSTGLVLPGDRVEIAGEMKIATQSLDSDAAGRGVLYFEPAMRSAPADNAPVIIGQPMGRFILTEDASWTTRPGMFSDITLNFIEA